MVLGRCTALYGVLNPISMVVENSACYGLLCIAWLVCFPPDHCATLCIWGCQRLFALAPCRDRSSWHARACFAIHVQRQSTGPLSVRVQYHWLWAQIFTQP